MNGLLHASERQIVTAMVIFRDRYGRFGCYKKTREKNAAYLYGILHIESHHCESHRVSMHKLLKLRLRKLKKNKRKCGKKLFRKIYCI